MLDANPYYAEGSASAAFYDAVTAADAAVRGDVELYGSLVSSGSVLELGSGTGRVSVALARRGLKVVGLELSAPMLRQAIAQTPPGLPTRYVLGDMRNFSLGERFNAVIAPYYALAHLPPREWGSVMRCVVEHLRPGAVAAFHMPIAETMAAPAPPAGTVMHRSEDPPFSIQMVAKHFDPLEGRMDLFVDYKATGYASMREHLSLFSGDLPEIAKDAGLVLLHIFPLTSAGALQIYRLPQVP